MQGEICRRFINRDLRNNESELVKKNLIYQLLASNECAISHCSRYYADSPSANMFCLVVWLANVEYKCEG